MAKTRNRAGSTAVAGILAAAVYCGTALAAPGPDLGRIAAAELAGQAERWTVLDARPRARWAAGHLPGARVFSWEEHTFTDAAGARYRLPPARDLAAALGGMGIDRDTPVAVYGDADTSWGGEGWALWVLAWLGHRGPLRLLDGGVQAWQAAGLPLSDREPPPAPTAAYHPELRPELRRDLPQLQPPASGEVLVDTRSTWEWLRGRLPGAVHLAWTELYTGPQRRPLAPPAYRERLAAAGVGPGQIPVFYCTGGVRSAYGWLVHQLAGAGPAANFEGGTEAWRRRGQAR